MPQELIVFLKDKDLRKLLKKYIQEKVDSLVVEEYKKENTLDKMNIYTAVDIVFTGIDRDSEK